MNKIEAINKIKYSLETEDAQVITFKNTEQEHRERIQELSEKLLASVIEPVRVTITSACALEGDFEKYKKSIVWGIAEGEGSWLLTLESEREFALGFGSDPNNIMMHGFSSSDALGEWCV